MSRGGTLFDRLDKALGTGRPSELADASAPLDERDLLLSLGAIHRLHLAPLGSLGRRAQWQHHPAVAETKGRLENQFLAQMDGRLEITCTGSADAGSAIRALVARDLVPPVYDWLADEAGGDEIRWFLSLEGGPDAGFDDLVAICQIGVGGEAKLELAANYWDEMGRGAARDVHTTLYRRLVSTLGLEPVRDEELPLEVLRRNTLTAVLATNRHLQPELVGALGTIEMQAGPRCRRVVRALERVGEGDAATAFYKEHAEADPRHGRNWLDHVVRPLSADSFWAAGMVRGAAYRCAVNHELFCYLDRSRGSIALTAA